MVLLQSTTFWYLIALVILFGLAWWKGRKSVVDILDARIMQYTSEIEDARVLRVDALKSYEDAKKNNQRSKVQMAEIAVAAENEAELFIKEAAQRRKQSQKNHIKTTDYRTEQQYMNFIQLFRAALVERGIRIVRETFRVDTTPKVDEARVSRMIELIKSL